jgi:hypothetical protein
VAVGTGISPRELLALDGDMFDAVLVAYAEHWPPERELLASALEVQHAQLIAFVRAHAKRGARLPEPLRVERPERITEREEPTALSVGALAELVGQDVTPVEGGRGR